MQVFHDLSTEQNRLSKCVLTIGNFDGVHLGHQKLLLKLKEESIHNKAPSVVLTFDPHPAQVLFPEKKILKIFDRQDQRDMMKMIGMDYLIEYPFSREFSQMTGEQFLNQIVLDRLNPICIVVGYDFAFGAYRSGSLDFLENFCQQKGISFQIIGAEKHKDEIISSTLVRDSLVKGDLKKVNELLGRKMYFRGPVVKGNQLGRTIGVPTANIQATSQIIPRNGVYTSWFRVKNKWYPSITNIGHNPTVSETEVLKVETHIFNFSEDIYGDFVETHLVRFLRDEKKFSNFEELKKQIYKDLEIAKEELSAQISPS